MQYRREVDGLRFVAVVPVLLFHAGFEFASGGFLGVDIFFVISGYLITSIILGDLEKGRFSIADFYERRARRILPALTLVFLAITALSLLWMMPLDLIQSAKGTIAASLFVSNIFFWQTVGYFQFGSELNPVLHTWSLSVEEQYYLFFPVFMAFFWFLGRTKLAILIFIFACLSLALAQYAVADYAWASFYLIPTRAWELFIGCLAAFAANQPAFMDRKSFTYSGLSTLGMALILGSMAIYDETTPIPSIYILAPTLGTAMVLLFTREKDIIWRLLANRLFVGVGLVSYSAYLWHQPLFVFTRLRSIEPPSPAIYILLIILSLGLAYLSWRYIESPFRNRSKFTRRSIFIMSGASIFVVILIQSSLIFFNGIPKRLPQSAVELSEHFQQEKDNRNKYIEDTNCHSWGKAEMNVFNAFIRNWSCYGDQEDLELLPAFITGDSVAAGVAMSLELNGLEIGHMSSATCSLVPSMMTPQCKIQSDKLIEIIQNTTAYKELWLINRFHEGELDIDSVKEMIDYFSPSGAELVFFSSRPQFYGMDEKLVKIYAYRPDEINSYQAPVNLDFATDSERPELLTLLSDHGVKHVNTREVFCTLTESCNYKLPSGDYLYVDKDHLSLLGAKYFGAALIEHMGISAASKDVLNDEKSI